MKIIREACTNFNTAMFTEYTPGITTDSLNFSDVLICNTCFGIQTKAFFPQNVYFYVCIHLYASQNKHIHFSTQN